VKAVLQYRASAGFRDLIERSAPSWLTVVVIDEDDTDAFTAEMRDAVVLLHVLTPVTAEVMAAAPSLRLIQKIGTGVNTIDLDAAAEYGIGVANMPGTNTAAVVEATLALMLATLRRITTLDTETRAGRGWHLADAVVDRLGELGARTVGLVGFGAVGQRLAPVLRAMGAEVLYTATAPKPQVRKDLAAWCELDELVSSSDIVSLHLPLTPGTEQIIDEAAIASMRPGAILVNTARGGLVDEVALLEALTSGALRGAGLDVFALEPVDPTNPLLAVDSVVVSPHSAWLTPETLERSMGVAFENCRRVMAGESLLHEVVPHR